MLLFSGPATLLCCLELESISESFSSFVLFWFFFLLLPLLGLFFVLPCIENYQKVDLRTITLDVPPQEVTRAESCNYSCALYRLSQLYYYYCYCSIYLLFPINLFSNTVGFYFIHYCYHHQPLYSVLYKPFIFDNDSTIYYYLARSLLWHACNHLLPLT